MCLRHRHFIIGLVAATGLSLLATATDVRADHLTVSSGKDDAAEITGAVRYRNFPNQTGQARIQVGDGLTAAGDVANPVPNTRNWTIGDTLIEISYTVSGGVLKTVVGGTTVQKTGVSAPFNYLQITVNKNQDPTTVSLNNLFLDGHTLGNRGIAANSSGIVHWNVTGIDLSGGFTLTGTLNLAAPGTLNDFQPSDSNYVQVSVGSVQATDGDAPVVSNVTVEPAPVILNGEATVRAQVDDSTTGGSAIASADYSVAPVLNGVPGMFGPWIPMVASSGTFGTSVSMNVKETFTAQEVGTYRVCVQATDVVNNTSDGNACQDFLVTYYFDGFFRPVDNSPIRNIAKAGQTIPIKWRLEDANYEPIEYGSSFAGLYSYEVPCNNLSTIEDAIGDLEYAPGASGLQYNGFGEWQFNWKTPKEYANKCRVLYLQLDSGHGSPVAYFQFRK